MTGPVQQRADAVADLLEARLSASGEGLDRKLRWLGHSVPRRIRRAGRTVVQAAAFEAQPRLRHLIDPVDVDRADRMLRAYLEGIDPAQMRRDRWIRWAAGAAFNLFVIAGAVIACLAWRGYLGPAG